MTPAELERRLFEVLGAWAPEAPEPEAKLLFRVHSFRHARHAELWDELEWEGPGPAVLPAAIEQVAQGPADTPSRLRGVYEVVLPALVAEYGAARVAGPPPPIARALDQIVAEDEKDVQEGGRLLAKLSTEFAATRRDEKR